MKRLLPILMGLGVLLGMQQAQAFDPEDLKRLEETNSCIECDLQGANLRRANLKRADLSFAVLHSVNLRNATLIGANFQGANLYRSNLQGALLDSKGLAIAKASGAIDVPGTPTN